MNEKLKTLQFLLEKEKDRCQLDGTGTDFDEGYYHGLNQAIDFILELGGD